MIKKTSKGIIEIEFIIAVFVFVTSISFVTLVIVGNIPLLHNTALGENSKAMSYQYSEMLLFDEGYPTNWPTQSVDVVKRLGFSTGKRYFVDANKIVAFNDYCNTNGYDAVKNILGVDTAHDISVEVSNVDGSPVVGSSTMICAPGVTSNLRQQFSTTRLGLFSTGKIVKVKVTIIS